MVWLKSQFYCVNQSIESRPLIVLDGSAELGGSSAYASPLLWTALSLCCSWHWTVNSRDSNESQEEMRQALRSLSGAKNRQREAEKLAKQVGKT